MLNTQSLEDTLGMKAQAMGEVLRTRWETIAPG